MCGKNSRHYNLAVAYYGQVHAKKTISEKKDALSAALAELDLAFEGIEKDDDYNEFRNGIMSELKRLNN